MWSYDMKYDIILTHIEDIQPGDTILCPDNKIRTVSGTDIKHDKLMGRTLFGDSYRLGHAPVKKLNIYHAR